MYDAQNRRFVAEDPYWNAGNRVYGDEPRVLGSSIVPDIAAVTDRIGSTAKPVSFEVIEK
jgi:hypothetical protein